MKLHATLATITALLSTTTATAQVAGPPGVEEEEGSLIEFGSRVGVSWVYGGGVGTLSVDFPGGGPLGLPVLYMSGFIAPRVAFEPQLGFTFAGRALNDVDWTVYGVGQFAYYLQDRDATSLYLLADVAVQMNAQIDNRYGAGTGVGVRFFPMERLAIRVEARYRHWGDRWIRGAPEPALDEVTLGIGFGIAIRR